MNAAPAEELSILLCCLNTPSCPGILPSDPSSSSKYFPKQRKFPLWKFSKSKTHLHVKRSNSTPPQINLS